MLCKNDTPEATIWIQITFYMKQTPQEGDYLAESLHSFDKIMKSLAWLT